MSVASGASLDWQGPDRRHGRPGQGGAGTLVLGNDNQYAGGTVVNAGTVQVARDANLGAAAGAVTPRWRHTGGIGGFYERSWRDHRRR